ncbi:hypothetical protein ACWDRX_26320, partial [Streptomyces nigra]
MTPDRAAGLVESARALAEGEMTSQALVADALARIEATQGSLNAFRVVRAEAALAEAHHLRAGPRRGDGRGHHLLHQHLQPVRHGRRR